MISSLPAATLKVRAVLFQLRSKAIRFVPVVFVIPAPNARALPHKVKFPELNRTHALLDSERSLVFTKRVLPAKMSASPTAGRVPAQLAPVPQVASPPPPDHVSCACTAG